MSEFKPTAIQELKDMSAGKLVELPPYVEGQKFFAMLRRPSMMALVKAGKIPNKLLSTANNLFAGGVNDAIDVDDGEAMSNLFEVMDVLCDACFVEPSYREMKENGIELTDQQLMAIFAYTQQGVTALDSFRG